jgi:hypothetical protein
VKLIYRAQTYEYTPPTPIQSSYQPCPPNETLNDGAIKLIYRGQTFAYTPPPIQPEAVPQSMQILRYRGAFYIREMRSNDNALSEVSQESHTKQHRSMGLFYKLYSIGWRNSSIECLPLIQHWVLSIFIDYRKGFAEGYKGKN